MARDKAFFLLERLPQLPEEGFVLANSIPGVVISGLEIEYLAPRPRSTGAALERSDGATIFSGGCDRLCRP